MGSPNDERIPMKTPRTAALVLLTAMSCSTEDPAPKPGGACEGDEVESCRCDDADGIQTCLPDGTFSDCLCVTDGGAFDGSSTSDAAAVDSYLPGLYAITASNFDDGCLADGSFAAALGTQALGDVELPATLPAEVDLAFTAPLLPVSGVQIAASAAGGVETQGPFVFTAVPMGAAGIDCIGDASVTFVMDPVSEARLEGRLVLSFDTIDGAECPGTPTTPCGVVGELAAEMLTR